MKDLEKLYILSEKHPILFFDGECNLCNGFVQLLIDRDKLKKFRYAPLQTELGIQIRQAFQIDPLEVETVYLLDNRKFYELSDASLQISKILGFPWSAFRLLGLIPKSWRDSIYKWVAGNRYKWFGRKDQCMVPEPGIMEQFILSI